MHCPNCGHSAQPGLARCGHCNHKLPETALPGAALDSGKTPCWNCSHENAAHVLHCVQCNVKQQASSKLKTSLSSLKGTKLKTALNTASHDE